MKSRFEISKAVIQKGERYLLLKRASSSKSYPAMWDFPGGKDEPAETPTESVMRETKEETALDIAPGLEIERIEYEDNKHVLTFHYFTPNTVSGEIKLSPDHAEYRWLARQDIDKLELHPSVISFFKD